MIVNKNYKVRLYPNKQQGELIDKTIGCCRFIYNQMLNERIEVYKLFQDKKEELKKYKYKSEVEYKIEFEWLKEVSSRALQQSRINLEKAYSNFFMENKKGNKKCYPKFKSKHKSKLSYREPQVLNQIEIENNKIKILKLGWVKFRGLSKYFSGKIKSVTIERSRDNKYYCSILVEQNLEQIENKNINTIGIDLGINNFVVSSLGDFYLSIKDTLLKIENKIKFLNRKLSKKVRGSGHYERLKIKINSLYNKISNTKDHYFYHIIQDICKKAKTIVIEDLSVKNMMKNRKLSHSIGFSSWSSFVEKLIQKSREYDIDVIKQDKFFPSSKKCSNCGNKKGELKLSDRIYKCEHCRFEIDRDLNSAINLRNKSSEYGDKGHGEMIRPKRLKFNLKGCFGEVSTKNYI